MEIPFQTQTIPLRRVISKNAALSSPFKYFELYAGFIVEVEEGFKEKPNVQAMTSFVTSADVLFQTIDEVTEKGNKPLQVNEVDIIPAAKSTYQIYNESDISSNVQLQRNASQSSSLSLIDDCLSIIKTSQEKETEWAQSQNKKTGVLDRYGHSDDDFFCRENTIRTRADRGTEQSNTSNRQNSHGTLNGNVSPTKCITTEKLFISEAHAIRNRKKEAETSKGKLFIKSMGGEDKLLAAARRRMKRQKEKSKASEDSEHKKEGEHKLAHLTDSNAFREKHEDTNPSNIAFSAKSSISQSSSISESESDAIASKCFETFVKEVKDFENQCQGLCEDGSMIAQHAKQFSSFLTKKYIEKSLDKLPPSNTVNKVRRIIKAFINKCASSVKEGKSINNASAFDKFWESKRMNSQCPKTWTCLICTKSDQPIEANLCSTCGRQRGYKAWREEKLPCEQKDNILALYHSDPIENAEKFLANDPSGSKITQLQKKTDGEMKEKYYLHRKLDYEADSVKKLADDINETLGSIRLHTT